MDNNKEIAVKKISRCKEKNNFNFSKEIIFKLKRKLIDHIWIKIHLKHNIGFGQKGIYNLLLRNIILRILNSDEKISELTICPDGSYNMEAHWNLMREKPEERIFMWHNLKCF